MSRIPVVDGMTKVFPLLGDPIAQVQTPSLINPIFAKHQRAIVAVPFQVAAKDLQKAWDFVTASSNIVGVATTVPHKVAAAELCDTLTPVAAAVGATNCAQRSADGKMFGALFDGLGFIKGLGEHQHVLEGASVLLVGAGGAGRAIAHALVEAKVRRITIIERHSKSMRFTVDMANVVSRREIADTELQPIANYDLLINATPLGLKSGDQFPIDLSGLGANTIVSDIASLSKKTELLAFAEKVGCSTTDGSDMLLAQISLIAGFAAGGAPGEHLS